MSGPASPGGTGIGLLRRAPATSGGWGGVRTAPATLVAWIAAIVVGGYVPLNIVDTLFGFSSTGPMVAVSCVAVALGLIQAAHFSRRTRSFRDRHGHWTLLAQLALTAWAIGVYGPSGGLSGFLGASVLLILPPRAAWPVFALVPVGVGVRAVLLGCSVITTTYLVLASLVTALVIFGLTRLNDIVFELRSAQEQLAMLAVTKERLRFARDLHDLLGYNLSAITVKTELVRDLVDRSPDRARAELTESLQISRRALADVRAVARGYRRMALAHEAASARSVLSAAGIDATVVIPDQPSYGRLDPLLAAVLREGVTNLLRHSAARHCRISVGEQDGVLRVRVTNDGVPPGTRVRREGDADWPGGLADLRARLATADGQLIAGVADGRFHLVAELPYPRGGDALPVPAALGSPVAEPRPDGERTGR
jgi:two-component system sensor histidine kinase DesK